MTTKKAHKYFREHGGADGVLIGRPPKGAKVLKRTGGKKYTKSAVKRAAKIVSRERALKHVRDTMKKRDDKAKLNRKGGWKQGPRGGWYKMVDGKKVYKK